MSNNYFSGLQVAAEISKQGLLKLFLLDEQHVSRIVVSFNFDDHTEIGTFNVIFEGACFNGNRLRK